MGKILQFSCTKFYSFAVLLFIIMGEGNMLQHSYTDEELHPDDASCQGGRCGEVGKAFRSAMAADEDLRARELRERLKVQEEKLRQEIRRRKAAFLARSSPVSGGAVPDAGGVRGASGDGSWDGNSKKGEEEGASRNKGHVEWGLGGVKVDDFLRKYSEMLSDMRLNTTGTREKVHKSALRHEMLIPQGLVPGNTFNVEFSGALYPVSAVTNGASITFFIREKH
jgi:hypothetical protein